MDFYRAIQYVLFVVIITVPVKPLGGYMERVFSRKRTALDRFRVPVERLIFRVTFVAFDAEMTGKEYSGGRRSRLMALTPKGTTLLARAVPIWRRTHHEIEGLLPDGDPNHLRSDLRALSVAGKNPG